MPLPYCFPFVLGSLLLGFQWTNALKCLEEIPEEQPLHTVNCAYFAFGNAQVCYSVKSIQGGEILGLKRGCQYLTRLGNFPFSNLLKPVFKNHTVGIDIGPVQNLTEEMTCELRKPTELDFGLMENDQVEEIEICVCVQDLCNTYISNGAENTTKQPLLLNLENRTTSILSNNVLLFFLMNCFL